MVFLLRGGVYAPGDPGHRGASSLRLALWSELDGMELVWFRIRDFATRRTSEGAGPDAPPPHLPFSSHRRDLDE